MTKSELNPNIDTTEEISRILADNSYWYTVPIEQRNQIVKSLRNKPEKLIKLSRQIGTNVGTTTCFGRSFDILEASIPFINPDDQGRIEVLDIGPGMSMPAIVEICHLSKHPVSDSRAYRQFSNEPFEIVAALQAKGIKDVKLTAFDIDPLVLAIINTQRTLVIERYTQDIEPYYRNFLMRVDSNAEPVLGTEILEVNTLNKDYPEEHFQEAHLLNLPTELTNAITTEQGDISNPQKIQAQYDLVYYLAVSIYIRDQENALTNVTARVRKDGILVTSEIENPAKYGLEELTRVPWRKAKVCYRRIKE